MARKRMVTRTFKMTDVDAVYVDMETHEVVHDFISIPGVYDDAEKALQYIAKTYNTSIIKYVSVESMKVSEVLKGMSEEFFFDNAETLPPRA